MFKFLENKKTKITGVISILLGIIDFVFPDLGVQLEFEGVKIDTPSEFMTVGLGVFLGRDILQKFQP